ncbi:MAG: dolichol kinase [Ignavibacteria bacterium]|nr:dolichol kinase [Ignavibacteria bacterium]MBI3765514.1 dolichol kinase [Ignavibacteriales bacterium]
MSTSERVAFKPNNVASGIENEYRIELIRKAIHLCSIAIPVIYFFTPRSFALTICVPCTLAFIAVDVARYYNRQVERWFYKTFGWLLRKHETDREKKALNGASYVLIAATLTILIFPKIIAVTAFIVLIISDMTSALVGRRFGKHRFLAKSLEGSAAFFVSACVIIVLTPKIEYHVGEYIIGIIAAAIGTFVEALPVRLDDNLTIPISVGASMWAGYTLIYPAFDMYKFG